MQRELDLVTKGALEPDSTTHNRDARADRQQRYEIRVKGHLGSNWASWFDGLALRHTECGDTVLSGPLPDQTALHGVLMKIRDLGLTLISVKRVEANHF